MLYNHRERERGLLVEYSCRGYLLLRIVRAYIIKPARNRCERRRRVDIGAVFTRTAADIILLLLYMYAPVSFCIE